MLRICCDADGLRAGHTPKVGPSSRCPTAPPALHVGPGKWSEAALMGTRPFRFIFPLVLMELGAKRSPARGAQILVRDLQAPRAAVRLRWAGWKVPE